jgi:hypothetical protein
MNIRDTKGPIFHDPFAVPIAQWYVDTELMSKVKDELWKTAAWLDALGRLDITEQQLTQCREINAACKAIQNYHDLLAGTGGTDLYKESSAWYNWAHDQLSNHLRHLVAIFKEYKRNMVDRRGRSRKRTAQTAFQE